MAATTGLDNFPLQELSISAGSVGDNIIIPGIPGNTIRVFQFFAVVSATGNVTFKDGPATAFDGPLSMTASGAIVFDFTGLHWFQTSPGNDFIINLSAGTIDGRVYFTQSA